MLFRSSMINTIHTISGRDFKQVSNFLFFEGFILSLHSICLKDVRSALTPKGHDMPNKGDVAGCVDQNRCNIALSGGASSNQSLLIYILYFLRVESNA